MRIITADRGVTNPSPIPSPLMPFETRAKRDWTGEGGNVTYGSSGTSAPHEARHGNELPVAVHSSEVLWLLHRMIPQTFLPG